MAAAGAGGAPAVEDRTLELPIADAALRLDQGLERDAWPGALRLARFFESSPGDRTPPPVESVAFLISATIPAS